MEHVKELKEDALNVDEQKSKMVAKQLNKKSEIVIEIEKAYHLLAS